MRTIPFSEYREGVEDLIDEETVPVNLLMDYSTRNDNIKAGRTLCDECDGTGNYFMYMYRQCTKCLGKGYV